MADQAPAASSGRSITIVPDDTSVSLAQAIYHHVTTKTERILESFPDNYVVCEGDIVQLCHIIKQVAQRHHQAEWSCVIDHSLFKRSRTRHSSLERFRNADRSQSDPTGELVITYDFLCTNPFSAAEIEVRPERYKVMVTINQEPHLTLMEDDDAQPHFFRRLISIRSIVLSIQYVDYTIARAILAAIREWVDGLENTKRSKLSKFLMRNEFSINELLPAVLAGCVFIGAAGISPSFGELSYKFLFSTLAVSILVYGLGYLLADSIAKNLSLIQTPTVILLTRGDQVHRDKLKKRKDKAIGALSFIGITIALAIFVNVFSNYVYEWIR